MSARPDLTTEELIRWCEECAVLSWNAGPYYEAIAQRLRSERPAVTPEMLLAGIEAASAQLPGEVRGNIASAVELALEAALSVSRPGETP